MVFGAGMKSTRQRSFGNTTGFPGRSQNPSRRMVKSHGVLRRGTANHGPDDSHPGR
jgi:hypothetical protein